MRDATTKLVLHDQRSDTITHRYSVQTEEGGVLFLFDPVGITAREVMDRFCRQSNYFWEPSNGAENRGGMRQGAAKGE